MLYTILCVAGLCLGQTVDAYEKNDEHEGKSFFDPSKRYLNLQMYDEDMGQTFGYYGMGAGFYFVWPFFGPSSGRDTLGMPFDLALDPASYFPGVSQFRLINNTSLRIGEYEDLKDASLDHYSALRNAYFQYRENAVKR